MGGWGGFYKSNRLCKTIVNKCFKTKWLGNSCPGMFLVATIGALVIATNAVEMQRPTVISRAKINWTLGINLPTVVKLSKIPDRVEGIGWRKQTTATRRFRMEELIRSKDASVTRKNQKSLHAGSTDL